MNGPEHGGFEHRPELDSKAPELIFEYAQKKQALFRYRHDGAILRENIDYLASELDLFVAHNFDTPPEVTVQSGDIEHATRVRDAGDGKNSLLIEIEQLPLSADTEVLGEHILKGRMYGFHRGRQDDIRLFVEDPAGPVMMNGGIFNRMYSVGLENATVHLAEKEEQDLLKERDEYIRRQLEVYDKEMHGLVALLVTGLNTNGVSLNKKLNESSRIISEITKHEQSTSQFIDALLDYIRIKLRMAEALDISVSAHQVVITDYPRPSYRREGPASFQAVNVQLAMIGETTNKVLGLLLLKNETAIRVPVQHINTIHPALPN